MMVILNGMLRKLKGSAGDLTILLRINAATQIPYGVFQTSNIVLDKGSKSPVLDFPKRLAANRQETVATCDRVWFPYLP